MHIPINIGIHSIRAPFRDAPKVLRIGHWACTPCFEFPSYIIDELNLADPSHAARLTIPIGSCLCHRTFTDALFDCSPINPQRPPSYDPYQAIAARIHTASPLARTDSSSPPPRLITSPTLPPSTSVPPPPKANTAGIERLKALVQDQQQTISLLVSEKSTLAASLERLEGVEARMSFSFFLRPTQRRNSTH